MSYTVLARKWRPQNFQQLVGQEHVQRAIVNAIDQGRLHHAYLFTGTRGVGKTTIARIFSKCLNCESGVTSSPCGECAICQEIEQGHFVDLMEIDAASRTKVEDTREILDNVQYRPTRGRYKVYLIDEVHMLSNSSFNALLKTLEEPPPHVIFLLATTDPQKLPVTVLSRCLQFHLKRMTPEAIVGHLHHILSNEAIEFDADSLNLIARAADGSMRDSLSLLDQAIAFGGGTLKQNDVADMLGAVDHQFVAEFILALANKDASALFDITERMSEFSPDYQAVLAEIISMLHRLAVAQALGTNGNELEESIAQLSQQLSQQDLQLFYQLATHARKDLPLSPDPRQGFEMALLRMLAFQPAVAGQKITETQKPSVQSSPAMHSGQKKNSEGIGKLTSEPTEQSTPHQQTTPYQQSGTAKKTVQESDERNKANDPSPARLLSSSESMPLENHSSQPPSPTNPVLNEAPVSSTQEINEPMASRSPVLQTDSIDQNQLKSAEQEAEDEVVVCEGDNRNEQDQEPLISRDILEMQAAAAEVLSVEPAIKEKANHSDSSITDDSVKPSKTNESSSSADATQELTQGIEDNIQQTEEIFEPASLDELKDTTSWHKFVQQLGLSGSIFQVLNNSRVVSVEGAKVTLNLLQSVEHFLTDNARQKIGDALNESLNDSLVESLNSKIKLDYLFVEEASDTPKLISERLHIEKLKSIKEGFENNPKVSALLETFGANISLDDIQLN
ncbi:DNA polymerase III subunit gamma/tau [Pleionea sediminis]|uniref:DNA polymerase III subunit gamma/tau n=1 Tax=Pleionea sediminis TaxID=2569479 RepID=UPI0011861704|nr:DNA polymerase III subunit gamma/tau [Pleionea sediminis]